MSGNWSSAVCATAIWVIMAATAYFEPAKRSAGEAWVVTSSDKIASRQKI